MIHNDATEPTHSSRKGWIVFAAFAAIAAFLLLSCARQKSLPISEVPSR